MFNNDWDKVLANELNKEYFQNLTKYLINERKHKTVYPPKNEVFTALKLTPYKDVRVVIIGQDPYHGPNQANGLAFSVADSVSLPPSLMNIYKELKDDLNITRINGDLSDWAKQGVLLLNSVLTVRAGEANSHQHIGWEKFTDSIIEAINKKNEPIVFILWGNAAVKKGDKIAAHHHIIKSAHPSPLSAHRGFFGSKPFSQTNKYLNYKIKW